MATKVKKTDEVIALDEHLSKSEKFIEKNLKTIVVAVVAVVIVVGGWFIYSNHMDKVESEAQVAISKSQALFGQEQFDLALNGDGATSIGFLKVIDVYGGTKTSNIAKLYAALCYANTGKLDEAIKLFEDFNLQDDDIISPSSIAALGNCYVKKGENEKGAELLVKAATKANNNSLSPVFLLQAGEIYESLNNNAKALELYKQIKEKYFRSPISAEIDKYINRVGE